MSNDLKRSSSLKESMKRRLERLEQAPFSSSLIRSALGKAEEAEESGQPRPDWPGRFGKFMTCYLNMLDAMDASIPGPPQEAAEAPENPPCCAQAWKNTSKA